MNSTKKSSQRKAEPRKTPKVTNISYHLLNTVPMIQSTGKASLSVPLASTSYCSELKKRLQESQREAEEGRERLKEVQSELAQTRAQLLEAKEKLELHEPKSHQRMDTDQVILIIHLTGVKIVM